MEAKDKKAFTLFYDHKESESADKKAYVFKGEWQSQQQDRKVTFKGNGATVKYVG